MRPHEIPHIDPRWDDVARKRHEAEEYARKGDMLAAAMLDHEASRLAEKLHTGASS